jgi:hypothetical protein
MMSFARFMAGPAGRAIRTVGGVALVATGLTLGGGWLALAAFGLLPLATGVFDLCPVAILAKLPVAGDAFRHATCPAMTPVPPSTADTLAGINTTDGREVVGHGAP